MRTVLACGELCAACAHKRTMLALHHALCPRKLGFVSTVSVTVS